MPLQFPANGLQADLFNLGTHTDLYERILAGFNLRQGQDLLRTKGILYYKGQETRRFAFQAVHMIADGDYIPLAAADAEGPRKSRIVFIGRNINRPRLRRGFESTVAA